MRERDLLSSRILVVDDDPQNLRYISRILAEAGYTGVKTTPEPRQVLPIFAEFRPDLILIDLHMPEMDGFEVIEALRPWIPEESFLPLLVLTGDGSPENKERALDSGAMDFLTKPFNASEARLRIRNLLATRHLHLQLQDHNRELEERVAERTVELERARIEILERLARAAEYRDDDTGEHTRRVGELSAAIGRVLGCPDDEVELLARAAPLHDIGKIGIPDAILLKPAKLSGEEFEVMRSHTTIGARILSGSDVGLLRLASSIALTHHERWDGGGYPEGISGEGIPLVGRIVSVADIYDALTHSRPYKPAWAVADAVAEIRAQAGRQLDPGVVEAFLYIQERRVPAGANGRG